MVIHYELQCNILEGLLPSIYDNYLFFTKGLILQYYAISWTSEKKYLYKFKLKHYEKTSMFIIDRSPIAKSYAH